MKSSRIPQKRGEAPSKLPQPADLPRSMTESSMNEFKGRKRLLSCASDHPTALKRPDRSNTKSFGLIKPKTDGSGKIVGATTSSHSLASAPMMNKLPPGVAAKGSHTMPRVHIKVEGRGKSTASATVTSGHPEGQSSSSVAKIPKRAGWDFKGKFEDSRKCMEEQRSKIKALVAEAEEKDQYILELQRDNDRLRDCEEQKTNLEQALRDAQTNISDLRAKAFKKDDEVKQLEVCIERLKNELATKDNELEQKKHEISRLTSVCNEQREEVNMLRSSLSKSEAKVNGLEGQISTQEKTIQTFIEKIRQDQATRRKLHSELQDLKGNIRVFCRVRPLLQEEASEEKKEITHLTFPSEFGIEVKGADVKTSRGKLDFTFDKVFKPTDSQMDVFEELSQLVQSSLNGYNVCVFAYGQTGSGKTYTMEGKTDEESRGMIPRTVEYIFNSLDELKVTGWEHDVQISFLEIYNEKIRDLLRPPRDQEIYDIRTSPINGETFVNNLKVEKVNGPCEVYKLLKVAQKHRSVADTECNEYSSRSHSVCKLEMQLANKVTGESRRGSLSLVDLAGSERLKQSHAHGDRLQETKNINRSLSELGHVISSIAQKLDHIPYRNCKLTHILQNSLGGNSKTLMFVNISPREECTNETISSLRFAASVNATHIGAAKKVKPSSLATCVE